MDESRRNQIREWAAAQKEALITDLMDLVNIESVSSPECTDPLFGAGCQQILARMLQKGRAMGFQATNYENFAGSLSLRGEEREHPEQTIGIWCHLDVVPAGDGWQTPPFEARYQNGLVTGRGSQDNKSAAAMGLYVLKGLRDLEISLQHPIALYFGLSEECGMQDLDGFLARYQAPGLSLIADCGFPACYGEKGTLSVLVKSGHPTRLKAARLNAGCASNIIPGSAEATLTLDGETRSFHAAGKAGHSAYPAGSVNAIPLLLDMLLSESSLPDEDREVLSLFHHLAVSSDGSAVGIRFPDERFGDLTCSATFLRLVDSHWELELDIRYPHSADPEVLSDALRRCGREGGCEVEIRGNLPSFGFSPDDPIVQKLTEVYNHEANAASRPYAMAGGTYAAKLPNAIPFGISFPDKSRILRNFLPGHGDYHQPDESVDPEQIIQALSIYLIALSEADKLFVPGEKGRQEQEADI